MRYLANTKELLQTYPIEGKIYTDEKYVKSACGIAYLGVLKTIEEYLQTDQGITRKEMLKKVEEYGKTFRNMYQSLMGSG